MPREARAAQFAPFQALTGFGATITEEARLTDEMPQLDEGQKSIIDMKLRILAGDLKGAGSVTVGYFVKDKKKSGGSIEYFTGSIRKVDEAGGWMLTEDGKRISFESILSIDGEIYSALPF